MTLICRSILLAILLASPLHPGQISPSADPTTSLLPSPTFQWNVSIYQILVGIAVGLLLQPFIKTLRLLWLYWRVLGRYSVQREQDDGKLKSEGGEILVRLNWWRGSFAVEALHATRVPQWKGEMHLSLDMRNVGNGVYWHVDEENGMGDQKVRYIPEKRRFRVQGVTFKAGTPEVFSHLWTKV
jgi:hypothetical protein